MQADLSEFAVTWTTCARPPLWPNRPDLSVECKRQSWTADSPVEWTPKSGCRDVIISSSPDTERTATSHCRQHLLWPSTPTSPDRCELGDDGCIAVRTNHDDPSVARSTESNGESASAWPHSASCTTVCPENVYSSFADLFEPVTGTYTQRGVSRPMSASPLILDVTELTRCYNGSVPIRPPRRSRTTSTAADADSRVGKSEPVSPKTAPPAPPAEMAPAEANTPDSTLPTQLPPRPPRRRRHRKGSVRNSRSVYLNARTWTSWGSLLSLRHCCFCFCWPNSKNKESRGCFEDSTSGSESDCRDSRATNARATSEVRQVLEMGSSESKSAEKCKPPQPEKSPSRSDDIDSALESNGELNSSRGSDISEGRDHDSGLGEVSISSCDKLDESSPELYSRHHLSEAPLSPGLSNFVDCLCRQAVNVALRSTQVQKSVRRNLCEEFAASDNDFPKAVKSIRRKAPPPPPPPLNVDDVHPTEDQDITFECLQLKSRPSEMLITDNLEKTFLQEEHSRDTHALEKINQDLVTDLTLNKLLNEAISQIMLLRRRRHDRLASPAVAKPADEVLMTPVQGLELTTSCSTIELSDDFATRIQPKFHELETFQKADPSISDASRGRLKRSISESATAGQTDLSNLIIDEDEEGGRTTSTSGISSGDDSKEGRESNEDKCLPADGERLPEDKTTCQAQYDDALLRLDRLLQPDATCFQNDHQHSSDTRALASVGVAAIEPQQQGNFSSSANHIRHPHCPPEASATTILRPKLDNVVPTTRITSYEIVSDDDEPPRIVNLVEDQMTVTLESIVDSSSEDVSPTSPFALPIRNDISEEMLDQLYRELQVLQLSDNEDDADDEDSAPPTPVDSTEEESAASERGYEEEGDEEEEEEEVNSMCSDLDRSFEEILHDDENANDWFDDEISFSTTITHSDHVTSSRFVPTPFRPEPLSPPVDVIPRDDASLRVRSDAAVDHYWKLRRYGESWRDVAPPEEYLGTDARTSGLEGQARRAFNSLVFDTAGERLAALFSDELRPKKPWEVPNREPPRSLTDVRAIAFDHVRSGLSCLDPAPTRAEKTWPHQKTRDAVDRVLAQELVNEEPGWVDYRRDEVTVKDSVSDYIMEYLIRDTVDWMKNVCCEA